MNKKLGSLESKLKRLGLDIFLNFLTLKTFYSNKPLKIARTFSSLVILMRVNDGNRLVPSKYLGTLLENEFLSLN
jgi:hypothetical protein